jgi:hypothetical protein
MNKHRELVRLGVDVKTININSYSVFPADPGPFPRPYVWDDDELILAAAPPADKDKLNYEANLAFNVALGKIEPFEGAPTLGVISKMAKEVEAILMGLEAETRRLFPAAF